MKKITILDSGKVIVPTTIAMRDFEIAQLLGTTLQFVRGAIKRLLKSRTGLDCSGATALGQSLVPEYFGLEVVVAVAFQVDSYEANIFRKWVMRKMMQGGSKPIYIGLNDIRDSIFS